MAGGNQYKCPNCDFVGRLGQLTGHLRENPEHWMVHCQECGVSIVTKKDIARHEEDTGHSTGLEPGGIINVQRTTKISVKKAVKPATKPVKKKIKSATKRKLMAMGISEEYATLLATGRNFREIKKLKMPDFVKILEDVNLNEVLSISKELVPDPQLRVPHNKRVLENLMKEHGISDGDEVLETALRLGEVGRKEVSKKQLLEAIKFLKNIESHPSKVSRINDFRQFTKNFMFTELLNNVAVKARRFIPSDSAQHSKIVGFSVSNFKGFKEAKESLHFVPIRPLTLVYGPNNGGKSSILKGFSSLGQTLAKVRLLQGNFEWSPNGMWYKLGASPHVLNNPSNTEFVLGFVLQNDKLQESCGRKFHEIRFTFSLETNEGVLNSLEFLGGDFEDYLDPILTIVRDDSIPRNSGTQMNVFVNTSSSFKLENYSFNIMEENIQLLKKQSDITGSIMNFWSMLIELEDKDELQRLRYECAHCGHISSKQKQMKKHLGVVHNLKNSKNNYNTIGFNADDLLQLRSFKVLAEGYFARNTEDFVIDSDNGGNILLEKFRSCLYIKPKSGQHPETFLDFEINLDEDTKKELLDVTSEFNLSTIRQHNVRWFGRPITFDGFSVIEPEVAVLNSLLGYLRNNLEKMDYLGATRLLPQRSYSSQTGGQTSQGVAGERTLAHLANDKKIQRWVNDNLADIVGLNINVKKRTTQITHQDGTKKTYPLDELDVRISRIDSSEDRLQLPDVGFGVSQLLPILAGIATPGRLVIEEPESNLHPGAQQKLMKKIIDQIVNNKNAEVMMETHSEHFLLEVLRAISDPECPLQDDDVAILYTYNTPNHGTVVKRHSTTNGTLDERFPKEFTGDYGLSLI